MAGERGDEQQHEAPPRGLRGKLTRTRERLNERKQALVERSKETLTSTRERIMEASETALLKVADVVETAGRLSRVTALEKPAKKLRSRARRQDEAYDDDAFAPDAPFEDDDALATAGDDDDLDPALAADDDLDEAVPKAHRADDDLDAAEPETDASAADETDAHEAGAALPIADYDTLNVKQANAALVGLSAAELQRVRAHEAAGKGRVTVLREIDRLLGEHGAS